MKEADIARGSWVANIMRSMFGKDWRRGLRRSIERNKKVLTLTSTRRKVRP